jgi:hypothetical protein
MPFIPANMSLQNTVRNGLAGSSTKTNFYQYAHITDTLAQIAAAGYFNDFRGSLQVGDRIDVVAVATPATDSYVVTAVPASGAVTVAVEAV